MTVYMSAIRRSLTALANPLRYDDPENAYIPEEEEKV